MDEHGHLVVNIPSDHLGCSFEYFCNGCGQLRLSYVHNLKQCTQCTSRDLVIGRPGELDKDKLKKEYKEAL